MIIDKLSEENLDKQQSRKIIKKAGDILKKGG